MLLLDWIGINNKWAVWTWLAHLLGCKSKLLKNICPEKQCNHIVLHAWILDNQNTNTGLKVNLASSEKIVTNMINKYEYYNLPLLQISSQSPAPFKTKKMYPLDGQKIETTSPSAQFTSSGLLDRTIVTLCKK